MKNPKHNLSTKRLTEFVAGDTIYCRYYKDDSKPLLLCEFLSYDNSKATVTARILEHLEWNAGYKQDEIIKVKYNDCALYGNATKEDGRSYYRFFDYSLYAMHPLEQHEILENDVHVSEHPSYGLARFSRINGGHRALFGSSIQNQNTITLSISRAKHERNIGNDWYYAKNEIIEIEMSQNQFSELITSFNMGSGIPVTIKHINHDIYPNPPFQSQADLHSQEFQKYMYNYRKEIETVLEKTKDVLQNKNSIGKGDRETMLKDLESLMDKLSSGIPYYQQQFSEAMEKTVIEAKAEVEAFIERQIRNKGLEALGYDVERDRPRIESDIHDQA